MHPPPPSSFQPPPSSLHPPPPSSFQPPASSLHHLQQNLNQNIARNWAIYPNLGRKIKSWHTWYIGGVNSESRLRFLKFRLQNPFLGKFGPKNSKLFVLFENWCAKYLKDADSESRLRLLKFQPQNTFLGKFVSTNSKLPLMSENWYIYYLKDANSESRLKFDPKIHFWANLSTQTQSCPF